MILILDFGSQYTQLIARRIRDCDIYCEIIPFNKSIEKIKKQSVSGIILSGGPASVIEEDSPVVSKEIFKIGKPVLGICYGQQLMCKILGGKVDNSSSREFGRAALKVKKNCDLFKNFWFEGNSYNVWMSHGDKIKKIPDGFSKVGESKNAPFAIIADEKRKFYGVQFHPEVIHTDNGIKLLENFSKKICKIKNNWNMKSYKDQAIDKIKGVVGNKHVICGLSGGVDSTVTAILLHKAIGKNLTCVFVDNGLLRLNEAKQVVNLFTKNYDINLIFVDASSDFLSALQNVEDPEDKRKIIGRKFIEIFEKEAKKLNEVEFLAQGTLYPDVIESISFSGAPSAKIKSHHNVGGLPEKMKLSLIEPLRDLFKDEVRKLGEELDIPRNFIQRHPFPGPGLGIRVIGPVDKLKLDILRKADEIYINEIKKVGLYDEIWQAFAVLLPVKTVGVMGDERTYEYVCSLRAVTSLDGMTADFYKFDTSFLGNVSTKIVNEVKGINRVVYDITSKPPGTIEWE